MEMFILREPITNPSIITAIRDRLVMQGSKKQPTIVESVDEIVARGIKGLQRCHCAIWLKYGWCHHSCADARRKGIIQRLGNTKDPNSTFKRGTKSAKNAKRTQDRVVLPQGGRKQAWNSGFKVA